MTEKKPEGDEKFPPRLKYQAQMYGYLPFPKGSHFSWVNPEIDYLSLKEHEALLRSARAGAKADLLAEIIADLKKADWSVGWSTFKYLEQKANMRPGSIWPGVCE